jgi:hypothetical protein
MNMELSTELTAHTDDEDTGTPLANQPATNDIKKLVRVYWLSGSIFMKY